MLLSPGCDPKRFALGVAIPLHSSQWEKRRDGHPRDFALAQAKPTEPFFARLRTAVELSEQSEVGRIVLDLSTSELPSLFVNSDVVVLVAHSPGPGYVELEDGVLDTAGFLGKMPMFSGCLDLVACFSEDLANAIRFSRGCVVAGRYRFNDEGELVGQSIHRAVMLYLRTLAGVLEQQRPYCEVMADVLIEWVEDR